MLGGSKKNQKPLNVLVLSDYGFGIRGGAERYSPLLASSLEKAGLEVTRVSIIGDGTKLKLETGSGIISRFHNPLLTKELKTILHKFHFDLVHFNILEPQHGFASIKALREFKTPCIATVHSYMHICPSEYFVKLPELVPCEDPYPNWHCIKCIKTKTTLPGHSPEHFPRALGQIFYNMYVNKLFLREMDYVISPSSRYTELLTDQGINALKILHPLYFPSNISKRRGDGSIVFVGRIAWEKGVQVVLKLGEVLNGTIIHVIGKGEAKAWLLRNKPQNIVYHGVVSDRRKFNLIANSSVVIVPSLWCDLFNFVTSEGLSMGKPVVAFDLGGPKEQIEASGGGLLAKSFKIADFIRKVNYLLKNPSKAEQMGSRGRKWVREKLDPESYGKTLKSLYFRTIEDSKKE